MKFKIGQVVHHRLFDYRGVVYGVDPSFDGTEDWYRRMAKSRPPKDKPWYRVLVHKSQQTTYVAERNLEVDSGGGSIEHPLVPLLFDDLNDGHYTRTSNWSGDTPILPTTGGKA